MRGSYDILLFLKYLELIRVNIPDYPEDYNEFSMVAAIKTNVFIEKDKKAIANVTKRMSLRATLTHTTPYLRLFGSILQPIKVLLEPLGYKASVSNIATIKYVMMTYIKDARYQHKLTKDNMQMCINKVFL